MVNQDIIVTFTSWKKRINNIPKVLETILKQTMLPGKIVLNLSVAEFPNKEEDLPKDVLSFLKNNNVEIYWIDGENTRQWKKIIPTLMRFPDKWTVCIDDDRLYKEKFIEKLWKKHLEFPENAITVNGGYKVNGCLQHCGHGTLECARFYDYFNGIDIDEIRRKTESSDTMFTYLLNRSKHPLICSGKDDSMLFNEIAALSKTNGTCNRKKHIEIWNWLNEKYSKVKTPNDKTESKKYDILGIMYSNYCTDVPLKDKKKIEKKSVKLNKRTVIRKIR